MTETKSKLNRRKFFTFASSLATGVACKTVGASSGISGSQADTVYDYIVVGSGAGGGPLAVNLANAGFKVLLMEAGTDQGDQTVYQVPAMHTQSTEHPDMAWDFFVKHFNDAENNKADSKWVDAEQGILYPRAGTLGGCTAHNAMITVYPLRKDWDQLCDDVGDDSFNHNTMRRYFGLWENARYLQDSNRKKGWLPVGLPSPLLVLDDKPLQAMLLAAVRSVDRGLLRNLTRVSAVIDLVKNPDINTDSDARDTSEGILMIPTATTNQGKRYSVRDYIFEHGGRNLTLRTSSLATRVLFDDDSVAKGRPKAIGVEYIVGDRIYQASKNAVPESGRRSTVFAKREVILAGGSFNTPQLLMLSGIGPKADLDKFTSATYKVILDRPGVGANLQDRYEVGVVADTKDPVSIVKDCDFKADRNDGCFDQWKHGQGPYMTNGGVLGLLKKSDPSLASPDLFMFLLPTDFHGYWPKYSERIGSAKNSMTWCILKAHTSNKAGRVTLTSLDPTARPEINFRYYEDGTDENNASFNGDGDATIKDLEAVVTAVQHVRTIFSDANHLVDKIGSLIPFPDLFGIGTGPEYFKESIPGPQYSDRDSIREWVRRHSWGHHACGTCKMGKASDPMAVVDNKFKVIGTDGLRIVDASIFPRIPGYFIVSSIYTMSERASDEIMESAGMKRRINV